MLNIIANSKALQGQLGNVGASRQLLATQMLHIYLVPSH